MAKVTDDKLAAALAHLVANNGGPVTVTNTAGTVTVVVSKPSPSPQLFIGKQQPGHIKKGSLDIDATREGFISRGGQGATCPHCGR